MNNTICTDPDSYQWQRLEKYGDNLYGYAMCQVIKLGSGNYAVLYGTIDPSTGWEEDVNEIASFFGYHPDTLLHNESLFAECIFEYCMDDFAENPYGLSPVYRTAEEACARCDQLMGESHRNMWLH